MSEYIITRDGEATHGRYATHDAAWHELLFNRQGQSVEWAMRHEGWAIVEVPSDSEPVADDDEQDVLYESGPLMTGAAVRASNPGGRVVEGVLRGYYGIPPLAQVQWVDLAFTPARYHEGSFVNVVELYDADGEVSALG